MIRILSGCVLVLCVVIGLELRAAPGSPRIVPADPPGKPFAPRRAVLAGPGAGEVAGLADAILARPLFSPGRRPDAAPQGLAKVPRLAGLLLSPRLRLALLQVSDAPGARPQSTAAGGEAAGWRLVALDAHGVLLKRGARTVRLTVRPAGARPAPPTPIDQIVMMPTKRTNPQLAW